MAMHALNVLITLGIAWFVHGMPDGREAEAIITGPSANKHENASNLPIVLWHGMGDTCCNPMSIGFLETHLKKKYGVEVLSINSGSESAWTDFLSGFYGNVNDQVAMVCHTLRNDTRLDNGFNFIGFSQGGQFARAVVQRCGHLGVNTRNLITLGGQHQGVMDVPGCTSPNMNETEVGICKIVMEAVSEGAYLPYVRNHIVQAQYFKDPHQLDKYLSDNIFLPDINNEMPNVRKQHYADNLLKLDKFVMIRFSEDFTVSDVVTCSHISPEVSTCVPLAAVPAVRAGNVESFANVDWYSDARLPESTMHAMLCRETFVGTFRVYRNKPMPIRAPFQSPSQLESRRTVKAMRSEAIEPALASSSPAPYDVIVVGSGLAGLTAAIEFTNLNPQATVCVLEAAEKLGGNSCKASSGINCLTDENGDISFDFVRDTLTSGGGLSSATLVQTLVDHSKLALSFLTDLGVNLNTTSQLGGHSHSRTHRNPSGPNVGMAIMKPLMSKATAHPNITVLTNTKMTSLESSSSESNSSFTVQCTTTSSDTPPPPPLTSQSIILATGGFGGNKAALTRYAPHYSHLPTTNRISDYAGDTLQSAARIGASLVDTDQVQVHPTSFVDPKDPDSGSKILAPEALRGSGAILLDSSGHRFTNELTTRDALSEAIFKSSAPIWLLTPLVAAERFGLPAISFYTRTGLMHMCDDITQVAEHIGVHSIVLERELENYNAAALAGEDAFGKSVFPEMMKLTNEFWVAQISPAVHYCMGGLKIESHGQVLDDDGAAVPGLFAAGECTGGLHGRNRLAGNSLLECVVFGQRAAQSAVKHAG